jgi:hypothetical protein
MRNLPTISEIRCRNREFRADLEVKAKQMGSMVPKAHYVPSVGKFYSAGTIASMIKTIRCAFNKSPETEFRQSFSSWAPKTAAEIIRWEIVPMIHERINIRGLIACPAS